MNESPEFLNNLIDTATRSVELLRDYLHQVTEGIDSDYCESTCEHILFKLKTLYTPLLVVQYDNCWKNGEYQPDLICDECPHRRGCSGYEED